MDPTETINNPYLLVVGKCYLDKDGSHYVEALWYKDLMEHCKYLTNLTLAAPCEFKENIGTDWIKLEGDPRCSNLKFCDLPNPTSLSNSIILLPKTISKLWSGIKATDIVHSGVANWPIPYGWIVTPLAKMAKKPHLIIVESAFWQIPKGLSVSWKFRLRSFITEHLNRWCVNQVDLAIFTEDYYRKEMLTNPKKQGYVIQASWIDQENIISKEDAKNVWQEKSSSKELRLLFAARLVESKGVRVLIEALKQVNQQNLPITIDILGEGDLLSECKKASPFFTQSTKLNVIGTVPYGTEFFKLLQKYHALIVPNITNEQPRIVFDGASQAVPILGTKTTGLSECVSDGKTGLLVPPNDVAALANVMKYALNNIPQLEAMGMEALSEANRLTHQEMHKKRLKLLQNLLTTTKPALQS